MIKPPQPNTHAANIQFRVLQNHVGHKVQIAAIGRCGQIAQAMEIECVDCHATLYTEDHMTKTHPKEEPIEKVLKYLPCLAIKDLSILAYCGCEDSLEWDVNNEHTQECKDFTNAKIAALSEITGVGVWCNGYSDTLLDYTPQTVFKWLNALKEYFGDFTCTVYFEDKQGNYYEAQKDTMNSAEDVVRDLYDQVTPF